jgi:hypothetical protein
MTSIKVHAPLEERPPIEAPNGVPVDCFVEET